MKCITNIFSLSQNVFIMSVDISSAVYVFTYMIHTGGRRIAAFPTPFLTVLVDITYSYGDPNPVSP